VANLWTRPPDVREAARKKWPVLLAAFAAGQEWQPMDIPLRGPAPSEIGERLGDVQEWVAEWERADRGPLRVEYKRVGGRHFGINMIPARAWLDGYEQAWTLLGAGADVRKLTEMAERVKAECPRLVPWLVARPAKALRLAGEWRHLLATVRWIEERQVPGMYLRQVDVPGVDTKFIGRHKGVLTELLDIQLDPARVNRAAVDFETRYGFRRKPDYVRFRSAAVVSGFTELVVRAEEFTGIPAAVRRAIVIENEITYLAFPQAADTLVIFGGGYAVDVLERVGWLAGLDLVYWGDIDTHGFAILNRFRHRFPGARSVLMDRATLLAHRDQWVTEHSPTTVTLDHLTADEERLYQGLVGNVFGPSVRLEQERIRFAEVERAVTAWMER
jgi:hypothetical protein